MSEQLPSQLMVAAALPQSEAQLRAIFERSAMGIALSNTARQLVSINPAMLTMLGYTATEMLGKSFTDFTHPDDAAPNVDLFQALLSGQIDRYQLDKRYYHKDGSLVWGNLIVTLIRDADEQPQFVLGMVEDITERKRAEAALRRSEAQQRALVRAIPDMIVRLHRSGIFLDYKPEHGDWAMNMDDRIGKSIYAVLSTSLALELMEHVTKALASDQAQLFEHEAIGPGGSRYLETRVVVAGEHEVLVIVRDVTDRKQVEQARLERLELERLRVLEQLAYQAQYDLLTGLPNRLLLEDRLQQAIAQAQRYATLVGVLFIDLDRFKGINETLGHSVGDALLKCVADRFRAVVRHNDTLARMGGDEFMLVLDQLPDAQDAVRVADKLLDALKAPFTITDHELYVTASIGISIFPHDGLDAATLHRNADTAMYRAKQRAINSFQCFTAEMTTVALEQLAIENQLRRALERNEFELYYQPQVALDGSLVGVEALLRWHHPQLGVVSPAKFIPIAEETGLIVPIGAWVLQEACRQNAAWQQAGYAPVRVAVNVSAHQFARPDFVEIVAQALSDHHLAAHWLDLELTESVVMHEVEAVAARLAELRALGVNVSIDDFGTGYSSLAYLQRLPITTLKIDRSFLRPFQTDAALGNHNALVATITTLGHSMGLQVIAEGVETPEQLAFLRSIGCDYAQGFLFSRPVPPEQLTSFFQSTIPEALWCAPHYVS